MAQNVKIAGASYSDVPAIDLPKSGGGMARFVDTSDANAAANKILSGYSGYVNGSKVNGSLATQTKSATPSLSAQTISPDSGKVLSSVSVAAITKELLASLDADFVAENIKKDVDLFGLIGALEGGGGGGDILGHKFVAGSFTLAADTTSNYTIMSAADLFDALKDDFPGATSLTDSAYRTNGSAASYLSYYLGGICWMDIDSADIYVDYSHLKMVVSTFLPPYKLGNSSNAMLYSDNYGSVNGRRQIMLNLNYNGAVMQFTSAYMGYAGAKYNYLFYVNNHGAVL